MTLDGFLKAHRLPESYMDVAQRWFNPLADELTKHQSGAEGPLFVGINGCQGSGKSTLTDYLSFYLQEKFGLRVVACSLDDFYLAHEERRVLSQTIHPLLATRGVPGTHKVSLLEQVLLHCQQANTLTPLAVPRFDKSTDNPYPKESWPRVALPIDILLFEGWCWGVRAQDETQLEIPINELEKEKDPELIWRRFVNTQIQQFYQPLYALMDKWIMLKAPSFNTVLKWREEQEEKLRNKHSGLKSNNKIMTSQEVKAFIQFFQRLTEHSLASMPSQCDWVFELDENRQIHSVSCSKALAIGTLK